MVAISRIGEAGLLKRIAKALKRQESHVIIGVGDDAAVFRASRYPLAVCSDMLVEHEDFELAWSSWKDLGHKAAAVNLSDLAAMGAKPRGLLLNLAIDEDVAVSDVMALLKALHQTGQQYGAPLVGGDLSRLRGPAAISVSCLGEQRHKILRRKLGQVGDLVFVSGTLGDARAGLEVVRNGLKYPALARRFARPVPRVQLGDALAGVAWVRSVADISDGLARDALHVVKEGGVRLEPDAIPTTASLRRYLKQHSDLTAAEFAAVGGEDFELVFTAPKTAKQKVANLSKRLQVPLHCVGEVIRQRGVWLGNKPLAGGFDHFS